MATAHLLFGYLGAGKTTLAKKLEEQICAVRFSPDDWMSALYGTNPSPEHFADYHRRIQTLVDGLWLNILRLGVDVILDFGFWERAQRDEVRRKVSLAGGLTKLYKVSADETQMLARCLARNENLSGSLHIEENTFHLLKARVEPLGDDEEATVIDS